MNRRTTSYIARALRRHREVRRVPQSEVATIAGITQASVSNYENGKREAPLQLVLALSDAWGLSVEQLLTVPDVRP